MKRVLAGLLVLGLVAAVLATPRPAIAGGRFWTGFAVGGVTGLIVGNAFAPRYYAPPAVVYEPAPVYVAPPPGYYYPAPVYAAPSPAWIPGQWVWTGYGWAWQPGYWRY